MVPPGAVPPTGIPQRPGVPQGWSMQPGLPPNVGRRMMPPAPPRREPQVPWWQRDGVISRVLAVAGVAVTLVGVVMLLVLAAQAGFFGPVPRVVSGAVFSAALVGAGVRVFDKAGGRVGGIALAATGVAGTYLDVVAVTAVYHWLHPVLGLAVALAVAASGVGLAMRWNSQPLAVLVVLGAALLAPFVTADLVLLGFLIVLQLACIPVQFGRDWPFLHVVRTVPAVLATLVGVLIALVEPFDSTRELWLLEASIAIAVVGLAGTVLVVRGRAGDITATLAFAISTTPLLAVVALFDRRIAALIAAAHAVVLLSVAATASTPKMRALVKVPGHTAIAAAVAGSFALLEACVGVTSAQTLPIATLLVALGFLGVAGQVRSGAAACLGLAFALIGGLAFAAMATPEKLASQDLAEQYLSLSTTLAAVIGLAVVAVAVWTVRRLAGTPKGGAEESMLWIAASGAALYLVTAAIVAVGVAAGAADGFVIGHSVATIVWMVAATAALLYGLRNLARSAAIAKVALGSGLLVTTAALAKLFLFDLATLDGLIRVAAFLVVGILLLLTGTRYARAFAEAGAPGTASPDGNEAR
ncbi:DUF2339 domain-containing protein [Nocardia xishanensis]|uniref:DUF2339 domain-containing protein n=1 Tax=Nocardia xishanensis TaxID=238964 RepID=UPI001FE20471|nr:DUF2339 domain-containing protein [Nocardia xishanensis]